MTPTEAERFFEGAWTGEGEIVGRGLLRWLLPREPFRLDVKMERLADSIWVFRDHQVFARGGEIRRTQFMERVGEGRYRASADDMPLGADVEVIDRRYRYAPYRSWMSAVTVILRRAASLARRRSDTRPSSAWRFML